MSIVSIMSIKGESDWVCLFRRGPLKLSAFDHPGRKAATPPISGGELCPACFSADIDESEGRAEALDQGVAQGFVVRVGQGRIGGD